MFRGPPEQYVIDRPNAKSAAALTRFLERHADELPVSRRTMVQGLGNAFSRPAGAAPAATLRTATSCS